MKQYKNAVLFICIAVISSMCSGCATVRNALPERMAMRATVDNMSDIRTYLGSEDSQLQRNLIASIKEENPADYPMGPDGVKVYPILAISGGSSNGAYGAGLLKGWSEEGSRPKFKIITGVSTGAITAPFVFLGKDYDEELEKIYTTMSTKDVMKTKNPIQLLFENSFTSNKPLEKSIDKIVTHGFLEKIAVEHKAGRRLYFGTTNLDSEEFIVWDMGAIAARGDKELFKDVTRASAAIPIIFPPVLINVKADGETYDEMHVDGGTMTQAFTVYRLIDPMAERAAGLHPSKLKMKYYLIRNGYIEGSYHEVKDDLATIAAHASDTMINAQGVGDTYRIYTYAKDRGNDFYLAFIPSDYRPPKTQEFDPHQMKELFDKGYQDAVNGYKWHTVPPGMKEHSN